MHNYDGKFWQVPKNFDFPAKTKQKRAWEFWLCGMKYREENIRPFRQLKPSLLPKNAQIKFKTQWQPILKKMENARDLNIPDTISDINSDVIKNTYAKTTEYLSKNVCSFLWEKEKGNVENLTVESWLTYMQHACIKKNGNQSNIANLPTETRYNMPHQTQRKKKKQ